MKSNKGFTLIELVIVIALLTGVLGFFWKILDSSSKDAYTINDKIEVQNSVTSLMNIVQQDVQEAKIILRPDDEYGIFYAEEDSNMIYEGKEYVFGDGTNKKIYEFDDSSKTVTRTSIKGENTETGVFNNIIGFSFKKPEKKPNYGVEVDIIGGKKDYDSSEIDKSRYNLNSTFYTRNTMIPQN